MTDNYNDDYITNFECKYILKKFELSVYKYLTNTSITHDINIQLKNIRTLSSFKKLCENEYQTANNIGNKSGIHIKYLTIDSIIVNKNSLRFPTMNNTSIEIGFDGSK